MKRLIFLTLFGAMVLAQTAAELPICAQNCISNSTAMQTACQIVDLRCLCTNTAYVNSLSCCLATQCNTSDQQKAIAFNQEECGSVNETAPGFVGCSPISLSSLVLVGGGGSAATTPAATATTGIAMETGATTNYLLKTLTGMPVTELASFNVTTTATATYTPGSLLTGSCTVPHFAVVTNPNGGATEYPEVGCSPEQPDCCPFPYSELAVLTKCPLGYTTTASGCCPSGYQIYFTALGAETPCYTMPPITYIPGSTPSLTISGSLTVITQQIFTKQYLLAVKPAGAPKLPIGGEIGIIVNAVFFFFLAILVAWCVRRHRKRKAERRIPQNVEMSEPELSPRASDGPRAFELASPHSQPTSPGSTRGGWPMGRASATAPPAYEDSRGTGPVRPVSVKPAVPQELPGSTYIYEHHPAFTSAQGSTAAGGGSTVSGTEGRVLAVSSPRLSALTPATPPRSPPNQISPRSAGASPPLPMKEGSSVVSPMNSPRLD